MSKDIYFYDSAGTRRRVKEFYFYDSAGVRRKVKESYFYDSAGVRRQNYSGADIPVITTPAINDMTIGVPFSQQMVATGTPPITWDLLPPNGWPPGISMNSTGLISGTPTGSVATWATVVRATNAGGVTQRSYSWKVQSAAVAPVITTTALNAMKVGTFFTQTLEATGSTPITWAVFSGTIPAGLTFANGVLSGTPTTAATYNFTIRATNSGGFDDQAFSPVVAPAITPPTILTTTLDLIAGVAFSQKLTATGDQPITFAVQAGTLPTGLTLSSTGTLSGTPSQAGGTAYNFTVRATNTGGFDDQIYNSTLGYPVNFTIVAGKPAIGTWVGYTTDATGNSGTGIGTCTPNKPVPPNDILGYMSNLQTDSGDTRIAYRFPLGHPNPGKALFTQLAIGNGVGTAQTAASTFVYNTVSGQYQSAIWTWPSSAFAGGSGLIVNGQTYPVVPT